MEAVEKINSDESIHGALIFRPMPKEIDEEAVRQALRSEKDVDGIKLLGIGETSDAYNAATPDPEAKEAIRAIKIALEEANLKPKEIDYINLHGTGTIANDLMEARAVNEVFGEEVFCSSTKPLTGHCLGAAASIETALCIKTLETGIIPPHIFDGEYDNELPKIKLVTETNLKANKMNVCMSSSFGFGGTNAILILGERYGVKYSQVRYKRNKFG